MHVHGRPEKVYAMVKDLNGGPPLIDSQLWYLKIGFVNQKPHSRYTSPMCNR